MLNAGNSRVTLFASQQATDDARQGEKRIFEIGTGIYFDETYKLDTFEINIKSSVLAGTNFQYQDNWNKSFFLPTDNLFNGDWSVKYKLGWSMDPFISFSYNTALMPAKRLSNNKVISTARLWDPIIFKENLGFGYSYRKDKDMLNSRLGFSFKQVRAELFTTLTDDRKTPQIKEQYLEETGINWKTDAIFKFDSIFTFRGMLEGFTTFEDMESWDVKFNNQIEATIYKTLTLIINLNFIYNKKQSIKTQYSQSFRIGVLSKIE